MAEPESERDWAIALYRRSVLKQRKLAELAQSLGATEGLALPRPRLRQRRRQPAAARARRLLGLGRPHRRGRRVDPLAGEGRRPPRAGGPAAVPGRRVRPRRRGRHARARARRGRLRARAGPRHPAGRAPGGEHSASQAHAAAPSAPRARPDRREARPPAPRLHARATRASCWLRPSRSRATVPTRASSRRRSTPPSTGASSAWARSPRPRAWWSRAAISPATARPSGPTA